MLPTSYRALGLLTFSILVSIPLTKAIHILGNIGLDKALNQNKREHALRNQGSRAEHQV